MSFWATLLTCRNQIHHFIKDNVPNFPICKFPARLLDIINPLIILLIARRGELLILSAARRSCFLNTAGYIPARDVLSSINERLHPPVSPSSFIFSKLLADLHPLSLAGSMTARFLLNLREWDHRMTNPEIDQWSIHGIGGDHHTMRFKKSERHTTQWTINDVLVDDPLLKPPVASEMDVSSSGALLEQVSEMKV